VPPAMFIAIPFSKANSLAFMVPSAIIISRSINLSDSGNPILRAYF
jgi:hypothetical protein